MERFNPEWFKQALPLTLTNTGDAFRDVTTAVHATYKSAKGDFPYKLPNGKYIMFPEGSWKNGYGYSAVWLLGVKNLNVSGKVRSDVAITINKITKDNKVTSDVIILPKSFTIDQFMEKGGVASGDDGSDTMSLILHGRC